MATENPERNDVRDPAEIERDIAQTREAIDSTVDELGQRLAPSQLMDDAKSYVKETAMRQANSLWNTMSDNAIPLLMIGGGIVWMVSSRRASGYGGYGASYGSHESRLGAGYQGGTDWQTAESSGGGVAQRTTEKAREMGEHLRETGAEVKNRAQHHLHRAQHGLQSMRQEQPLLLGVAALALGGLVGGLLPSTRREDELVGEVRDEVVGAAVQAGREKVEGVREAAQGMAEAASGQSGGQQGQQGQGQAGQQEEQIGREGSGRSGGRSGGRSSRPSPSPRI